MTEQVVIRELARACDEPIRIDWFGDIESSRLFGSDYRCVAVSCSRWIEGETSWRHAYGGASSIFVAVPLELVRLVRVGDIWHRGLRVGTAPLQRRTFDALKVNASTVTLISSGAPATADADAEHPPYVLPFSEITLHRDHPRSWLARIVVDASTELLVPSMELARFYFGSSGQLLSRIFSGPFAGQRLYTSRHKHPVTGVANIGLQTGLSWHAVTAVASIAFDDNAARAFNQLVRSGVVAAANEAPWYPRMTPPFDGRAELMVEGLEFERAGKRVFLALRILQSGHVFPFSKLFYQIAGQPSAMSAGGSRRKGKPGEAAGMTAGSGPRDKSLAPAFVASVDEIPPFPDLAAKQVRAVSESSFGGGRAASRDHEQAETEFSVGHPTAGAARGVEAVMFQRLMVDGYEEPRTLADLREALAVEAPEVRVLSPLGDRPVSRLEIAGDNGSQPNAAWLTCFDIADEATSVRTDPAILALVLEVPMSPEAIEMLMFKIARGDELDKDRCATLAQQLGAPLPQAAYEIHGEGLCVAMSADMVRKSEGVQMAHDIRMIFDERHDQLALQVFRMVSTVTVGT